VEGQSLSLVCAGYVVGRFGVAYYLSVDCDFQGVGADAEEEKCMVTICVGEAVLAAARYQRPHLAAAPPPFEEIGMKIVVSKKSNLLVLVHLRLHSGPEGPFQDNVEHTT
jgi:hypothetical protein